MSAIRELVFDWLFNASIQIGFFAILAASLSPLFAKAKAKHQHCLYLAVFVLCLAAPVFNTVWQVQPDAIASMPQRQPERGTGRVNGALWAWNWHSNARSPIVVKSEVKTAVLFIWQLLFLYQIIQFSRGLHRVHRLRRDASRISLNEFGMAHSEIEQGVVLLESTAIDDPVTVGVFHPAILLPSKLIPALKATDLAAILAHEGGHIRRKDFLVHSLCQFIALPVAWHPGIRYLMAKISQTRELACDDYAAARLGMRIVYARTLLRLASLCLLVPRSKALGLGIFDGDNLEDRIMKLTEKSTSLSRAGLIGLALATSLLLSTGVVLARVVSLQEAPTSANNSKNFAGTWHWMFHGQSFSTMILIRNGSEITGTVTPSRIALDGNGELSRADPSEDSSPSPILKSKLDGGGLRITVGDADQPIEFLVTLKDASHAEIHPIGAPANMKPIQAEKVN